MMDTLCSITPVRLSGVIHPLVRLSSPNETLSRRRSASCVPCYLSHTLARCITGLSRTFTYNLVVLVTGQASNSMQYLYRCRARHCLSPCHWDLSSLLNLLCS